MNTRTYQRDAEQEERDPDAPYSFKGPLLQRMSAEQIWDSFMTLIVPELDHRPGSFQDNRYRESSGHPGLQRHRRRRAETAA